MSSARKIPAKRAKTEPRVVHCKRESYDVLIDRTTKWGNRYVIGKDGDRATVIDKYRFDVDRNAELKARIKRELRGKVLGCWCAPLVCHGDVLLEIANS